MRILEMRVEKENLNVTFPGFIVNTCQNCDRRHAGVLAAAAPVAVKLLKLPKIADIETWIWKVLLFPGAPRSFNQLTEIPQKP